MFRTGTKASYRLFYFSSGARAVNHHLLGSRFLEESSQNAIIFSRVMFHDGQRGIKTQASCHAKSKTRNKSSKSTDAELVYESENSKRSKKNHKKSKEDVLMSGEAEGDEEVATLNGLSIEASMDPKFNARYMFFREYFTRPEALDLILSCPESLTDSEYVVKRKLEYLIKKASHKTSSIAKSMVLSYSHKHILMRHEFLTRAGLFKSVPYHKLHKQAFVQSNLPREKYFTPAEIVCTNDRNFLKKCTRNLLTHNELAAFEELFQVEYDNWVDEDEEAHASDEESSEEEETTSNSELTMNNSAGFFSENDSAEFYY